MRSSRSLMSTPEPYRWNLSFVKRKTEVKRFDHAMNDDRRDATEDSTIGWR